MLWIGPALGAVERACMLSVLRHGHPLTLHVYRRPAGVPDGVVLKDAADILPETRIVHHRSGSCSLFSNWFRYELMRSNAGLWLDCDIYLLAAIEDSSPYLFGEEEPGVLNTAVLRIPAESPLLPPLLALFEERAVPPWLSARARLSAHWRLRTRGRTGIADMPWGSTGPHALSYLARLHGLDRLACPQRTFYPVHWKEADWIVDPALKLEDKIAADSVALHLWNERIRPFKDRVAPAGSFLERLQQEGAR
jgi:hypothetical protein